MNDESFIRRRKKSNRTQSSPQEDEAHTQNTGVQRSNNYPSRIPLTTSEEQQPQAKGKEKAKPTDNPEGKIIRVPQEALPENGLKMTGEGESRGSTPSVEQKPGSKTTPEGTEPTKKPSASEFGVQYDEVIGNKTIRQLDMEAGVLKERGYIKNPSAKPLEGMINNYGKINGPTTSGKFMYVVNMNGNVIIGTRASGHMPHPTLIGGEAPVVKAAGIIDIRGGRVYAIDNASGHFRPTKSSLKRAEAAFQALENNVKSKNTQSTIFHQKFQGYLDFEGQPYPYP